MFHSATCLRVLLHHLRLMLCIEASCSYILESVIQPHISTTPRDSIDSIAIHHSKNLRKVSEDGRHHTIPFLEPACHRWLAGSLRTVRASGLRSAQFVGGT